jgi:hypothetical protein
MDKFDQLTLHQQLLKTTWLSGFTGDIKEKTSYAPYNYLIHLQSADQSIYQ